jgi:hypothetical protein
MRPLHDTMLPSLAHGTASFDGSLAHGTASCDLCPEARGSAREPGVACRLASALART